MDHSYTNVVEKSTDYFRQHHFALIPLRSGTKVALEQGWPTNASTDPVQWQAWQAAGHNLAIHVGVSRLIVVDIDTTKQGGREGAWARFESWRIAHGLPAYAPHCSTGREGLHILFALPDGVDAGSLTGRALAEGVDVLCNRRYAVAPGSVVDGRPYRLYPDAPTPHAAPGALIEHCRRAAPEISSASKPGQYDLKQVAELVRWLAGKDAFADYADWLSIGMALAVEYGAAGIEIWRLSHDATVTPDVEQTKWRSFATEAKPGAVTLSTWFKRAHELGWTGTIQQSTSTMFAGVAAVASPWKSAVDLLTRKFEPVKYVVPRYIAEGCTLLAGRPKVGKSWLTVDAALAVAGGGEVLGERVEQGDVLLLALEDNERRLQSRFRKVLGPFRDAPGGLTYATEWPRVDEGGLEKIQSWISAVSRPRLIVVDVLARVRPQSKGRESAYEGDYQAIAGLQKLASEHRVAVVVVHHLRKTGSDSGDAIDKISGTLGLSGAADSVLIVDRDGQGVNLYARGRDIEEIETAISFDRERCRWTALGQAGEVRRSDERRSILDALNASPVAMKRSEIAEVTGMRTNNVGFLLNKMMRDGQIMRGPGGGYLTASPANRLTPLTPLPSQHQIELSPCPVPLPH